MPFCLNLQISGTQSQGQQSQEIPYTGPGSGNRIVNAAMKYLDKYMPRGATGNNGTYYCNALVGCVLQDLGIWKSYSNANDNSKRLRNDNRFSEIRYTSGEKAMPGDIMCIERTGGSGHNMICIDVDSEGRVSNIIGAGSSSDKKGKNHVDFRSPSYPKKDSDDYKHLCLFRLK